MSAKEEVSIRDISRYLGGFAVLISAFIYIGIVAATTIIYTYGFEYIAKILYYLGFIGLIIAILAYIVKDEKTAKIFYGGSLFLVALSLLLVDTSAFPYDTGMYYGATIMFLLLGIILTYVFMNEEKFEESMKNLMEPVIGIIYIVGIVLWVEALGVDLSLTNLMLCNYFIPQTLLLGGAFGVLFGIVLLIDGIVKFAWKEAPESVSKILKLLLVFLWLLGYIFEAMIRPALVLGGSFGIAPPIPGIAGVFVSFYVLVYTIFFAILLVLFVYHIIVEYAV